MPARSLSYPYQTIRNGKRFALVLAVVLVAGALLAQWWLKARPRPAEYRTVTLRLTGVDYAPLASSTRSATSARSLQQLSAIARMRNSDDERVAAIALLLGGNLDEACETLEKLALRSRKDAAAWSDLAAARYERAKLRDDALEFARALAAADEALRLDAGSAAALFNRAMILDTLGLNGAAATAYRRLLETDTSPWATEARSHLREVTAPTITEEWERAKPKLEAATANGELRFVADVVRRMPQQARTWCETEILGRWGERRASQDLAVCRAVGNALRTAHREHLLADAVLAVDAAPEPLARAHAAFLHARKAYHERRLPEALDGFTTAQGLFRANGSPFHAVTAYLRGNVLVDLHRENGARSIVDALAVPADHLALRAQIEWLRSTLLSRAGRPFEALTACRESASLFASGGETEHATRMRTSCAALMANLGQKREAWMTRRELFAGASRVGRANLLEGVLHTAARDAMIAREYDAAIALFDIELAAKAGSPRLRADALLWRAVAQAEIEKAPPDLRRAIAHVASIRNDVLRADSVAELRAIEARFSADAQAEALLTQVIDYQTENRNVAFLPSMLVQRARARRGLQRVDEAHADLQQAVELLKKRGAVARDDLRDRYFASAADAYDELTEVLIDRREFERAFEIADRARGRIFADRRQSATRSLRDVQSLLPAGVVVAHYTTLSSRTLLLRIDRNGHRETVIDRPRVAVAALRDQLVTAITADDDAATRSVAREAGKLLLDPLGDLSGVRTLIVIGDATISSIPFAALTDARGAYLIDSVAVAYAPSASTLSQRRSETGMASTDATFREAVPHIQRLTRAPGNATSDLHSRPQGASFPHGDVFAYVFYPPGSKMRVFSFSSCKAKFELDDPNVQPVPVSVINELKASIPTGTKLEITRNGQLRWQRVIPPDSVIIVGNNSPNLNPAHFAHYRALTNATRIAKVVRDAEICTFQPNPLFSPSLARSSRKPLYEPYTECTNSQWP